MPCPLEWTRAPPRVPVGAVDSIAPMYFGGSLFIFAIGAILAFAVDETVQGGTSSWSAGS